MPSPSFPICNLKSAIYNGLVELNHTEIEHAARLLREGRLVAFPTETVYGLGASALDPEAVARIFAVKGRPSTSPLIVHVGSVEMAKSLVENWPDIAQQLADRYWPGPLTLVLPVARDGDAAAIPPIVTAGLRTVGLRMPSHPIALALLRAAGIPLAAPSANRFTQLSPTSAEHIRNGLGEDVDYILDGGPCQVGIESTVLSLAGPQPILLRPGGVSRLEIESVIGPVTSGQEAPLGAHPSPGMHPRHYSPRTPLFLINNGEMPASGQGAYLQHTRAPRRADMVVIRMPQSARDYAMVLYEELHRADEAGHDWIAVDSPPSTPEWEAVLDRLRRAARS